MYIGYVILAVAAMLLFLLLIPIRVIAEKESGFEFYIKILFVKIRPFGKEGKQKEAEKKKKQKGKRPDSKPEKKGKKLPPAEIVRKITALGDDIKDIAAYCAHRCIVVEKLNLLINFGVGDAAKTGVANGMLNGVVYTSVGIIHHNTLLKKWNVEITPDFQEKKFNIEFLCIVRTRLLHIIGIGIKGFKLYTKFRKI